MQICGCDVINLHTEMILDGYVLWYRGNEKVFIEELAETTVFEILHIVVKRNPLGYREISEKITCRIKARENYKAKFSGAEEAVKAAKEALARRCKHQKILMVDETIIKYYSRFSTDF